MVLVGSHQAESIIVKDVVQRAQQPDQGTGWKRISCNWDPCNNHAFHFTATHLITIILHQTDDVSID